MTHGPNKKVLDKYKEVESQNKPTDVVLQLTPKEESPSPVTNTFVLSEPYIDPEVLAKQETPSPYYNPYLQQVNADTQSPAASYDQLDTSQPTTLPYDEYDSRTCIPAHEWSPMRDGGASSRGLHRQPPIPSG